MTKTPVAGPPRPTGSPLTDPGWAHRADEEERPKPYDGDVLVNVEGSKHSYGAGARIPLEPDQAGAAVVVTDEDKMPLAVFRIPELGRDDVKLVHPGPPRMELSVEGPGARRRTARLRLEVTKDAPSLLDGARWGRHHWSLALVLFVTWMIIGVQVTLVETIRPHGIFEAASSVADAAAGATNDASGTIGGIPGRIDWINDVLNQAVGFYLIGTAAGALLFGWLADRIGRRRVCEITALIYAATAFAAAAAAAWFAVDPLGPPFRLLAGFGAGGEYVALYTAIQELMPRRRRGWACLTISGAFWLGFLVAVQVSILLHDYLPDPLSSGAKVLFLLAVGLLGVPVLLLLRRRVPESPRWLAVYNRKDCVAERFIEEIRKDSKSRSVPPSAGGERLLVPARVTFSDIIKNILGKYYRRMLVGSVLLGSQSFFYNATFFKFWLMLDEFYGTKRLGLLEPKETYTWVALANFAGPVLLGWCFDLRRRRAVTLAYAISGCALLMMAAALRWPVWLGLSPVGMVVSWALIFFLASTAASSAYLTVGESFPVELRGVAFAVVLGVSMFAGLLGLHLHDRLLTDAHAGVAAMAAMGAFCALAGVSMAAAAAVQWAFGTEYAKRSLDERAPPLSRVCQRRPDSGPPPFPVPPVAVSRGVQDAPVSADRKIPKPSGDRPLT